MEKNYLKCTVHEGDSSEGYLEIASNRGVINTPLLDGKVPLNDRGFLEVTVIGEDDGGNALIELPPQLGLIERIITVNVMSLAA